MWSIIQNYAEFKLIEGYNTIPNFCKIIVFFGIPQLSISKAFTQSMQQMEDLSPYKDTLMQINNQFNQAASIVYDWQDTVVDFCFMLVTIGLLCYVLVVLLVDVVQEFRRQSEQRIKENKHTCFICGQNENDLIKAKLNWKDHIQKEHNVLSYIYYILYIQQTVKDEYAKTKGKNFNLNYFLTSTQQ